MEEIGKVVKINSSDAVVRVDKKDECSKCGMCLFPKNAAYTEFVSANGVGAKEGDLVRIKTSDGAKFIGIILVFLVPLILIGLATLINYLFINNEIWIVILGVIFIILWYTILAAIDKKLKNKKNFKTEIVCIIKEEQNGDN